MPGKICGVAVLVEDEADDVVDCAMVRVESKDRVIRRVVANAREKVAIVVFAQRGRLRGGDVGEEEAEEVD